LETYPESPKGWKMFKITIERAFQVIGETISQIHISTYSKENWGELLLQLGYERETNW
jgi:hypothetical protein